MKTTFSARVDAAMVMAAQAHAGQLRKGTGTPYIVHPFHVALILGEHGFGEDLVVAGLLHDTVEDTPTTIEDVRAGFGDAVAALVAAVTERKRDAGGVRRPWRVRKEEQLAHLAAAPAEVAALKAADTLHNASCTLHDVGVHGAAVWSRFNAGRDDGVWYYREVARLCGERLGDHPLAGELAAVVARLTDGG